jgi:hypothetical protein
VSTGTDLDEYKIYMNNLQGMAASQGVGEVIYDDADSADDIAEFARLTESR